MPEIAVPPSEFGCPWPQAVALQIHTRPDDEWGDVDVAREMAETDYDESATALVLGRVRSFLDGIE